jgi:hypothetical protein
MHGAFGAGTGPAAHGVVSVSGGRVGLQGCSCLLPPCCCIVLGCEPLRCSPGIPSLRLSLAPPTLHAVGTLHAAAALHAVPLQVAPSHAALPVCVTSVWVTVKQAAPLCAVCMHAFSFVCLCMCVRHCGSVCNLRVGDCQAGRPLVCCVYAHILVCVFVCVCTSLW